MNVELKKTRHCDYSHHSRTCLYCTPARKSLFGFPIFKCPSLNVLRGRGAAKKACRTTEKERRKKIR